MTVNYLNLEYIILRVFAFFTGIEIDFSKIPDTYSFWAGQIALLGFALTFVLFVLFIYTHIRLASVEREGFHLREEREREMRTHETTVAPKNPRWEQVLALSLSPNDSDWRRAILEADVLLVDLLQERGFAGDTLGEQLKQANPLQFATLDLAWQAHKMRNALAHLGEAFPLSERDMRATIDLYSRVFEEFEYI